MSILDAIPGVAQIKLAVSFFLAIVLIVTILGGGAYLYWYHNEFARLEANNKQLETNNQVLQTNNDTIKGNLLVCENTNASNNATITALLKERDQAKVAVATLAKRQATTNGIIANLQAKLAELLKDPVNDGALAPDLRETVRDIQVVRGKDELPAPEAQPALQPEAQP